MPGIDQCMQDSHTTYLSNPSLNITRFDAKKASRKVIGGNHTIYNTS